MMQLARSTAETYNSGLAKVEQNLSIKKSLMLAPLIISEGPKKAVVKHIIKIIEFFLKVTGKAMEDFQIIVLAGDLYDLFKTDTLDDVILMFKMARTGEFGKIYGFDSMVVMEWARKYLDRKSEEREKLFRQDAKRRMPEAESTGKHFTELPPELQEKFSRIGRAKPHNFFEFMKPKATAEMTEEKHRREILKNIENENPST